MAKLSALDRKIADIDADIARLTAMRDYLAAAPADAAPKRTRKAKAPKTPATESKFEL